MNDSVMINERLLQQLVAILSTSELKANEMIAKQLNTITDNNYYSMNLAFNSELNNKVINMYKHLDEDIKGILSTSVENAYANGKMEISKQYEAIKGPNTVLNKINDKKVYLPQNLKSLILMHNNLINNSILQVVRNTNDNYRNVLNQVSSQVLTGADTPREAAFKAMGDLAYKGINGFTDKLGRNWNLQSYVTMAVRTITSQASLQGHVDRMVELKEDLMIVSQHGGSCPLCAKWAGKVLSISGKNPKYPSLQSAKEGGLFHPNCKHTINLYIEGLMNYPEKKYTELEKDKYIASQKMRYHELNIRKLKNKEIFAVNDIERMKIKKQIKAHREKLQETADKFGFKVHSYKTGIFNGKKEAIYSIAFNPIVPQSEIVDKVAFKINKKPTKPKPQSAPIIQPIVTPIPTPQPTPKVTKSTPKPKTKTPKVNTQPKKQKPPGTQPSVKNVHLDATKFKKYEDKKYGKRCKDELIKKHANKLDRTTIDEIEAVRRYTGGSYVRINNTRRGKYTPDPTEQWIYETIKHLESVIPKVGGEHPLQENSIFFRHDNFKSLKYFVDSDTLTKIEDFLEQPATDKNILRELKEKIVDNIVVKDKGFMSVSRAETVFVKEKGIEFKILLPKGYDKIVSIEHHSQHKNEYELLIAPDTEFIVDDVSVTHFNWTKNISFTLKLKGVDYNE